MIDFSKRETNVEFRQSFLWSKRKQRQEELHFDLYRTQVWRISEGMMKEWNEEGSFS
jgi:hypothetical protein